jgi:hypothetical protein
VLGPALPGTRAPARRCSRRGTAKLAALSASSDGAFLTRIGLDGRAIGNPVRLSPETAGAASRPSLVATRGGWIAAWRSAAGVEIASIRIDRAGARVTAHRLPRGLPTLSDAIAIATPRGAVLVGPSGDDLVVVRSSAAGAPSGRPQVVRAALAGAAAGPLAAAALDRTILVALPDHRVVPIR